MTNSNPIDLLVSNAKIEENHALNGSNDSSKTHKPYSKLGGDDPSKMSKSWDGTEISPLAFINPLSYKLVINLKDEIVTKEAMQSLDPNLRVTKGLFMIKYIPRTDRRRKKGRPFCIGQDLIRMGVYVSGIDHWNYLCDRIPELDWIRRNSIVNTDEKMKRMMNLAVKHPGMAFWFSVDWIGYYDKLKTKLPKGEDDIERPYAAWKCSAKEYKENYEGKEAVKRGVEDVRKILTEVDQLPSVQKEMLEATGEVGYSFEQEPMKRDPKTGRFLKKEKE